MPFLRFSGVGHEMTFRKTAIVNGRQLWSLPEAAHANVSTQHMLRALRICRHPSDVITERELRDGERKICLADLT